MYRKKNVTGDDDVGACPHANKQVDNPSENDFLFGIYCAAVIYYYYTAINHL